MRWNANNDGSECARKQFSPHILAPHAISRRCPAGVYKTVLHWRGVIQSDYLRTYFGKTSRPDWGAIIGAWAAVVPFRYRP
jgi:hypothetical protein